jgi:hypothetical protein
MDPERWQRLSPLLDALFELDDDERERSLRLMREGGSADRGRPGSLLKLETDREDFLSSRCRALARPAARRGSRPLSARNACSAKAAWARCGWPRAPTVCINGASH